MNVYFISGMGADERVFKYISLPPNFTMICLPWLDPIEDESLEQYSKRLANNIDVTNPFVLVGLSMGGMIATEIAKILKPFKLILLSSVPVAAEMPGLYRTLSRYKFNQLVSPSFLKNASILKKFFGKYKPEYRKLLVNVIRDSDPHMLRWALKAIGSWDNKTYPEKYFHIHGNNDNVLPSKNTHPTHIIKGGRHFMVVEKSAEISKVLAQILTS